jgi:RNA polymerase sigma factor (sigma-70 family)
MDMQSIFPYLKTIECICLKRFSDTEEGHACYVYVLDKLNEDNQRRIRQFQGKSSFKTYIVSITTRLAIDFFRSRYGRTNPCQDTSNYTPNFVAKIGLDDIPELQDNGLLPDQMVSLMESISKKKQVLQIVQTTFQHLSDEERLVLKLRFNNDQKISQIAKVLALNQRNLYNYIERILNRFKKAIKNEGLTDEEIKIVLES